jgi:hypothetical protein
MIARPAPERPPTARKSALASIYGDQCPGCASASPKGRRWPNACGASSQAFPPEQQRGERESRAHLPLHTQTAKNDQKTTTLHR